MLEVMLFASLFVCGTYAQPQGSDMDDSDFAAYIEAHERIGKHYGSSAGKGCITGGIGGAPGGWAGFCLGCALGATGNVAQDVFFNEKADNALRR